MENQGRICPRGASYYTWRAGDTVQAVAQANGTTVQAMQVINPDVNFSTIAAGTEICLPSQSYTCISGAPYAVQAGDTFTSIADRLGITTYELAERNPGVNPDNITIGQVLCVPFASSGNGTPEQPSTPSQPSQPSPPTPSTPSRPSTPPIIITPVQPACPAGYTRAAVLAGETYADLLVKHNVSYRAMRNANPRLSPGYLIAGQVYCAPPHGTRALCSGTESYTIRAGETLDTIAADLGITRGRLLSLNPNLLPSDFTQGAVICIP